ncbi:tRNA(Met) cytidine acetyltransferase [Pseudidiomarina sp. 1APP75-27a]|uniref:GNAT family N-acetyltransferase n=1 Tax=Pseudidiomarina terrestris TaxID=2820060 RepID=UPI002B0534DA|nr:GNAT family N-acetyltransferase [Pseudidiomarina sp. 1APP75-27a]MEA3588655.1 tRNA(Met) cytidine acetyltransferase [Pseudidiomarina sp. 1APP75-27a]
MSLQASLALVRHHLKTARQRAVFIFSPDHDHERAQLRDKLLELTPNALHFSDTTADTKAIHRYRDVLGQTYDAVLLDYQQLIHADALAAVTGTIRGGGILWVILPAGSSAFKQRLLESAEEIGLVRHVGHWQHLPDHLAAVTQTHLPASAAPDLPSASQAQVISQMTEYKLATHLLLADRGRGKSTTLGLAIKAAGYSSAKPILVTAPQPQAAATLLKHAAGGARFRAWDRLLKDSSEFGAELVIDEAAAIPLHILKQLQQHFRVWAIATTVDGYEGCGKGFALRFLTWLKQSCECQQHQLTEPLRWSTADAVEAWLNQVLMLKLAPLKKPQATSGQVRWHYVHASELSNALLQQVMTLLLEAHYQSSPNDLRLLLDDPAQHLGLLLADELVIGVCWVAQEGPIELELQQPVLRGERRLKGQLLPQAIGFYRQQPDCLAWRWLRIVRIATHPELRRQGIGRRMLAALHQHAQTQNIDALGTSFGITPAVEAFWQTSGLVEIRRGQKKNMASGAVSAIWAQGLTTASCSLIKALQQLQEAELGWQRGQTVPLNLNIDTTVVPILRGFAQGYLPLSNARFAWWYILRQQAAHSVLAAQPRALFDPAIDNAALTQINHANSRAEFENQLREIVGQYLHYGPTKG